MASGGQFDGRGNKNFRGNSAYIGVREATDLQEKRHTHDVLLTNILERVYSCPIMCVMCRDTDTRGVKSRAHALDSALRPCELGIGCSPWL